MAGFVSDLSKASGSLGSDRAVGLVQRRHPSTATADSRPWPHAAQRDRAEAERRATSSARSTRTMQASFCANPPRSPFAHHGRRNAQPPASHSARLGQPAFITSPSRAAIPLPPLSLLAHSIPIKPAPLIRLLLDIPEVKRLHHIAHNALYPPFPPLATPPSLSTSTQLPRLQLDCTLSVSCRLSHPSLSRPVRVHLYAPRDDTTSTT